VSSERVDATGGGIPASATLGATSGGSGPGIAQVGRRCRVEIGGPIVLDVNQFTNNFLTGLPGAGGSGGGSRQKLILDEKPGGLRVKFKFEWQVNNWTPNVGFVEIYGLNDEDRKFCSNRNTPVAVFAGYVDQDPLPLCGVINAVYVESKHPVADEITKFEGGDAGRSFANARAGGQTYAAGTPRANVALDLASLVGTLGAGSKQTIQNAAKGKTFRNGYVSHAKAAREFKAQMADLGLEYTISNQELVVFPKDKTTAQLFLVSPESGLIGSPEPVSPVPGKPQEWKIKLQLNALIRPGARIVLQSARLSGTFRAMTVSLSGDTHGTGETDWVSELTIQGSRS